MATPNHALFSVLGIEIEYMLVDCNSLAVQPKSDLILKQLAGELVQEVELGDISVSNELVLHVLELKNNGPKPVNTPVVEQFQQAITRLQPILMQHNMQLLPTAAHPWMDPLTETKRWPHGNRAIYKQYDTIFNCRGHGWANLQSMHVNLPFANDDDFFRLHNTVRLILPILPALAASSPLLDGKPTGMLDSRLSFYAKTQQQCPAIAGQIIPEFIRSEQDYQTTILEPMYQEIRPYDPEGLLQYEWLNSRAAIPKFETGALEIRVLDSQECVAADLAIAYATHAIVKHWVEQSSLHLEAPCATERLKAVYDQIIHHGFDVIIDDSIILEQWQLPKRSLSARDVWGFLIERVSPELNHQTQQALEHILRQGSLSERILRACRDDYSRNNLSRIYHQLGDCLTTNQRFHAS